MAAPLGNTNPEKWTIDEATKLLEKALAMSFTNEYDFIGEIARDLSTYRDVFTYLVDKFPELKNIHKCILSNLEANCFSHTKTNKINTAVGIVNLKSNYNWTDRQQTDVTTNGKDLNTAPIIKFVDSDDGN
jgi:hypothetical protein